MKPKIVILTTFLTPLRSGAEACAEEVAKELKEEFAFTFVTARMRRDIPKADEIDGIPVMRVGLGCTFDKWLFPFLAPLAIRKLHPDLIHAVLESFAGLALHFCQYASNAKRILTCQSTNTSFLLRTIHRSPHRITAISRHLLNRAQSLGRTDVVHIPNGLRLSDFSRREKVFGRILFAGRLREMKGIDTLLQAFVSLPPHAHLHIVGDGPLRQALEVQANMLGIGERVFFLGYIPTPDVYGEFAEAEIFCGLSRNEAFGNVFVEAQAAGCATVGTNIEGIPDIIEDGVNGLLVLPDDPDAATEALAKLLEDPTLRERLSEAGKSNAQHFDWSEIAKQYAEVYRSLSNGIIE